MVQSHHHKNSVIQRRPKAHATYQKSTSPRNVPKIDVYAWHTVGERTTLESLTQSRGCVGLLGGGLTSQQLDKTLNHHTKRIFLSCYDYYNTYYYNSITIIIINNNNNTNINSNNNISKNINNNIIIIIINNNIIIILIIIILLLLYYYYKYYS